MNNTGKTHWRSLDELADTPQFREWLHREFPENASEMLAPASRRTLLKLMGASLGLAGLTACSRPVERIMPASRAVEDYIPGRPLFYATAMSMGGSATGLLVEAHEGRPTKIEGNPEHPFSRGKTSAFAQASVLDLYDPDRAKQVSRGGDDSSWDEFFGWAKPHFAQLGSGSALRFLSRKVNSPSLDAVRCHALARFPEARWIEYEPISLDEQELAGAELAFGRRLRPRYRFDRAEVVFSLDYDFLGLDAPAVTYISDFADRRREANPMNRLYVVESQFSVTGGMADHRKRMRAGDVREFAADLARELGLLPSGLKVLNGAPDQDFAAAAARDLKKSAGRSIVAAGPRQPAEVHALAAWMNEALGNTGKTVVWTETTEEPQLPAIRELAADIAAGRVDTLVILGGNPVYDAPADLNFRAAIKKAPNTIHLGIDRNETAVASVWRLPEAHYLESWGDARAVDGTVSIQQPLIRPLYGGRTAAEVVAAVTGYKDQRGYDIVRNYWQAQWGADAGQKWRKCLHDGVVPDTAYPLAAARVDAGRVNSALNKSETGHGGIELAFYPSPSTWDGRFANNGWMQEAPDPITKLTWDNAALVSPATARVLGVTNGDVIALGCDGRTVEAPIFIQPGHADSAVSIALGYGRRECGRVGYGTGHDAYPLRTSSNPHFVRGITVRKTGAKYPLSATQEHHSMEGRDIVREHNVGEAHAKNAGVHELFSLYKEHDYSKGNQWGMAIDLNSCVGCNACVVACQAENNIPIVGKEEVARGREMHWIRMDRYYTGSVDDPQSVTQPVACMQCENAPCETVCPVAATSHSPEGLNDMAYNRCVGTRYCANNCPYKVRRFNFFDWHKNETGPFKMVHNPDVSVRMRGVMEKCTYCVQRIQQAKIQAKVEGRRELRDGEIKTACQQVCPAEAIVFGNINDPDSRVSKLRKDARNYSLLEELNTKPRTTYLAKLRNPNPELQRT